MKRLIVCCDGTWNNPEQEDNGIAAPTNVVRIHRALAEVDEDGNKQLAYYHPGVGGEEMGLKEKVLGGGFGLGVSRHIRSAYHWLGSNYEDGDLIYLFGFSRGAFTARSLGGMLACGLLDLRKVKSDQSWKRVEKAYDEGYRGGRKVEEWAHDGWAFFNNRVGVDIHFIGVWDTVGALGIPDDLEILDMLLEDRDRWRFHNTKLSSKVQHARHAMAIDEIRTCFTVTRWSNASSHKDALELWFPGVHCDVGGGYAHSDLSNGALHWMMEESEGFGLCFREGIKDTVFAKANPLGVMHNSYKGAFAKLRSRPRNMDAMIPQNSKKFHSSALERQKISPIEHPHYHPTTLLEKGESVQVDVYADTRWNPTHVYLPKGQTFTFKAKGKWQDSKDSCDWKGTQDGKLTAGDVVRGVSSFLGVFENMVKKLTKNDSTDFLGTKRVEHLPWFTLVGAIANDAGGQALKKNKKGAGKPVADDGSAIPHQYVELAAHETKPLKVTKPGYLYCFPNDVWSLYENNHGSVRLTITRVS